MSMLVQGFWKIMPCSLFYGIEDDLLGLLTERYNNLMIVVLVDLRSRGSWNRISSKLLTVNIVRTEPRQCWAFVIVWFLPGQQHCVWWERSLWDGTCTFQASAASPAFLVTFLWLVFVTSKNAAIPLLELTRAMVLLDFKFCYCGPLSDLSSIQSLMFYE